MKIVSNINGNTKTTSYGNKLFYRSSPSANYTQIKRAFYRNSPNANYTQVYLYDNVPPSITVTSSTATTATAAYTLTATISDTYSAITNIYVNNVAYPFTAGSQTVYLSKAFTLAEGVNYFTIKAIDEAQNIQEITVSLRYVNSDPARTNLLAPETEVQEHIGDYYITTKTNSSGEVYYRNYQRDKPGGAGIDETFVVIIPKGVQVISYEATKDQGFQFPTGFTVNIIDTTTSTILYSTTAPDASGVHHATTSGTYIIPESISYTHDIIISTYIKGSSYAETWGGGVGGGYTSLNVSYYF